MSILNKIIFNFLYGHNTQIYFNDVVGPTIESFAFEQDSTDPYIVLKLITKNYFDRFLKEYMMAVGVQKKHKDMAKFFLNEYVSLYVTNLANRVKLNTIWEEILEEERKI